MSEAGERLREGDLLTVEQALRLVPVKKSTLYALVESGQLPCYRVSGVGSRRGRILVHRADLEAFVQRARAPAGGHAKPDVVGILDKIRSGSRGRH